MKNLRDKIYGKKLRSQESAIKKYIVSLDEEEVEMHRELYREFNLALERSRRVTGAKNYVINKDIFLTIF